MNKIVLNEGKKRKLLILVGALAVLVLLCLYSALTRERGDEGPLRRTMCNNEKCKFKETRRIKNISDYTCGKCGGPLGFQFKCRKCSFEFPFVIPENEYNVDHDVPPEEIVPFSRCPNCNSPNIFCMPVKSP